MKLGHKLMIAPLVTALVVFSAGQVDSWLLSSAGKQAAVSFGDHFGEARSLSDLQSDVSAAHVEVYRMMTIIGSMDETKVQNKRQDIAARGAAALARLQAQADAEPEGSDLRKGLETAAQQLTTYFKQTDAAVDLASVDPNTGVAAMQGADEAYTSLVKSLAAIETELVQHSQSDAAASAAHAVRTHWMLTLFSLLATAVVLTVSWLMLRKVAGALEKASRVARAVADGDLAQKLDVDRQDELGELQKALVDMKASLQHTVAQVRQASDSIGVASAEIASGNQDLSARTEQTASNLEETAASMEQLTSTVRNSADAARQANQLAASASAVAVRGGQVVQQVVSTMQDIHHSSQKISDIIGTIDGIAFQTNILALNAAVEAARAGEQGRGFAVVAGEVRNLAQRSAEAAKEIKDLIGASVDKVDVGTKLVADAGQTMGEIVGSIQRVTDIVGEISSAAGEQSDGIGQVNTAVSQLDQMTQQNAALVEQSAAAAQSLKDQADRLAQVVQVFRMAHA